MLEIIAIFYLQRALGDIVEKKGYGSILIRVLFVLSWIAAEVIAIVFALQKYGHFGPAVGWAVGAIVMVNAIFFGIALALPGQRGTGRLYSGGRNYDDEPDDIEEFRRARRRAAREQQRSRERQGDERVRRKRRDDDEDEDLPRLPRADEDEDRPRRRRRRDED